MNDRAPAASQTSPGLNVLDGIHVLGCGLRQLDWTRAGITSNHVLDATSKPRSMKIDATDYEVGENVEFSNATQTYTQTHTFQSSAEYHAKSSLKANASGSYGAFSAGFEGTFDQSVDILNEKFAAVYSYAEQLWMLEIKNVEKNLCEEFVADVKRLPELQDDYGNIGEFVDFFTKYGADVVTRVAMGGSLTYSIVVEKNSTHTTTDLSATVKASYGTFVSGSASTSISEEQKKEAQKQNVTIKTAGGKASFSFNLSQPRNCNAEFEQWRASLPKAPRVVDIVLKPIYEFVPSGLEKQKEALKKARKWYQQYEVTIEADWQTSYIALTDGASRKAADHGAQLHAHGKPALHIVIVANDRHKRVDTWLHAPGRNEGADAFAAFWRQATQMLADANAQQDVVLLATERWPRDARYYPSQAMYDQLCTHGADTLTLKRWKKLVSHMQPCRIAGLTYVLAGKRLTSQPTDFVVAGFGTPDQDNICPSISVSARFVVTEKETRTLVTRWTEETNTTLHIIKNNDGAGLAIASDRSDKTRIEMVDANPKKDGEEAYLGQFWYLLPWSTPYGEIKHPHILINFETGACLQGDYRKGECRLFEFGDEPRKQQDDVIWDVRDSVPTHFLLVHYHGDSLNLIQSDKSASVARWRENYMIWSLRTFRNFNW
ncbi:hypothetical protein GCM10027093_05710 [Paraburkholderia jirisanensis]